MSFFHTYPNDVSLDDTQPSHWVVSIEYYDDDHDYNVDYIECDDMFGAVCLCDKLDNNHDIIHMNMEPIWNCSPFNMDQSPSTWTDW